MATAPNGPPIAFLDTNAEITSLVGSPDTRASPTAAATANVAPTVAAVGVDVLATRDSTIGTAPRYAR